MRCGVWRCDGACGRTLPPPAGDLPQPAGEMPQSAGDLPQPAGAIPAGDRSGAGEIGEVGEIAAEVATSQSTSQSSSQSTQWPRQSPQLSTQPPPLSLQRRRSASSEVPPLASVNLPTTARTAAGRQAASQPTSPAARPNSPLVITPFALTSSQPTSPRARPSAAARPNSPLVITPGSPRCSATAGYHPCRARQPQAAAARRRPAAAAAAAAAVLISDEDASDDERPGYREPLNLTLSP